MAKSSTGKSFLHQLAQPFRVYAVTFAKRPLWNSVTLAAGVAVYMALLGAVLPERLPFFHDLLYFITPDPKLEIRIGPTESYQLGAATLLLKGVTLQNKSWPLSSLKVSIRTDDGVDTLKITPTPQVECKTTRSGHSDGSVLFEVHCPSFMRDQRLEMRLVSKRAVEKGNVVVEAVGSYGRDRFVGASATGTLVNSTPRD